MGHRKPYILIGLLIQAVCLVLVTLIHPGDQFPLYVLTAFILQAGMALYDTCTDGLALDTTPESGQGTIQGLMVGGRALGVVIVSGVIGLLVQRTSWSAAFYLLAALTSSLCPWSGWCGKVNALPNGNFNGKLSRLFPTSR
jgi:PAT family beta-lactamase induction signal transducer AmpG